MAERSGEEPNLQTRQGTGSCRIRKGIRNSWGRGRPTYTWLAGVNHREAGVGPGNFAELTIAPLVRDEVRISWFGA